MCKNSQLNYDAIITLRNLTTLVAVGIRYDVTAAADQATTKIIVSFSRSVNTGYKAQRLEPIGGVQRPKPSTHRIFIPTQNQMVMHEYRAGATAVDLVGPSTYQGRPKFGIISHNKLKSCFLQKSKLVDRGPSLLIAKPDPAPPLLGAGPS